ncbi:MAG: PqqD family protein [Theionarchaea archaeon]|nr:PqqD family protein [Theionarchaea archaeon]
MEDLKGKYIRWSDDCVWQSFGDSISILRILPPEQGLIPEEEKSPGVRLSTGGKDIWGLCDGTRTIETIVCELAEEYEGDPEEMGENVKEVISTLKEKEFLTYEETPRKYDEIKILHQKYMIWEDNTIWNEVEGQVLALHNETGLTYEFTPESGELWKLCDGKRTVTDILSILEEKGIINENMSASGFILLMKRFVKSGLLVMKDAPTR